MFRINVMSSKQARKTGMPAPLDPEATDRPYRRKRKVEAGAIEGTVDGHIESANGAKPSAAPQEPELEPPVLRGQPLKAFVENWEYRWDLQRELYPWEWLPGGNLSDGPFNIIRYGQPPPKGWHRHR